MIGIYKITSPTGRVYIGQSINISYRFSTYRRLNKGCKNSPKLYSSLLKHGYINHKFEVLEECSVELLNERERYYQELFDATSDKNLNCILTKTDTKKGVSKPLSESHKKQISLVHKGKVYSEETRNKIKIARSKQIITKEHRDAISRNSGSARLVLNIENGIFYNNAKEAASTYGIKHNTLICNLIGKTHKKRSLIYV